MRIVRHQEVPEDPRLLRQWNDLALREERPEVFYTCEWAMAVQSAYGDSLKPLLFLGYEGDELVGVASLATDADQENISFLAATTADYCDFLSPASLRAGFVEAVFREIGKSGARSVKLANLPDDSATPAALRSAASKTNFHRFARPAYLCAQVDLRDAEKRRAVRSSLAGKKKLRQYLRGMGREGAVTITHLQSPEQIQAALPEFADAHVARFHGTQRASSLATPARRLFLQELATRFAGSGVVTLSMLKVGERPVAWNYGFRFHGSWFWYQPTFDSRLEQNSPGYCLLSRMVIEACDMEGMKVVDLGLGAEGYKERFGNSTRQTLHVTMTRSLTRHVREIARYRVASVVKRSPTVETMIRGALKGLQSARSVFQTPGLPRPSPRTAKSI